MLIALVGLLVVVVVLYLWERSQRVTHVVPAGLCKDVELPHEQEWELYHNDFSLCSKKSRVCLAELGIDYKAHHIDLIETGAYENISRHFLKVNPAALVPVLVHHGHPIYESHEQLAYAAAASEMPEKLVPEDPGKRQLMEHWVHLSSLVGDDPIAGMNETAGNAVPGLTLPIFAAMIEHIPFYRILEGLLFHRIKQRALFFLGLKVRGLAKLPATKPLLRVVAASRTAMHTHLDALEQTLEQSGGPWIVGAQFTLADVGMMVIFDRLREGDWLGVFITPARPRVTEYWRALQARPSYQSAVLGFSHPTVTRGTAKIIALKQSDAAFRDALFETAT